MLIKNEKQLLNFVKYSPIVVVVSIAIIVNILLFVQNELTNERDLKLYEDNYIETNKNLIKEQIDSIYENIIDERKKLEKNLRKELLDRINEAHNIVENLDNKFSYESREKRLKLVSEALRELRYNNKRGYFYIHTLDGKNIMHPIQPWLENKNLLELQDKKGFYLIKDLVEKMKTKDEYFSTFYWYKPKEGDKFYKKITINKKYEPLGIIIGTGEYIDDFEKRVKKYILEEYIQKISFGKNNYVFVTDYDGVYLAHIKKAYIGINRLNLTDKNGFKITKEIIKTAKQGTGYIRYVGTIMPQTGEPASKTTYVKGLQEWQWAIGTGFYDKDLQNYLLKKREELSKNNTTTLKKVIIISVVLTVFLIILASYISNILKEFFDNYNERILREVNANRKKDSILYQQAKMASMGEMIGNIAHQWRQPLTLISTAAGKIKIEDEIGIATKESLHNSADMIIKSTKYLSETIDDFREFFNPNKVATEFLTKELYEKSIKLISSRFSTKEIEIISNIENIKMISFENELIQTIINILNNAVDALENSTNDKKLIFCDIEKIEKCEMLSCSLLENCKKNNNKECILITIKDNAGGIPEDIIEKIFEAYFTTKHKSQGTGIGLYMTYQIITRHLLGDISVRNSQFTHKDKIYKGAEFKILLPLNY